ncbi:MAG: hypothetical protein ILO43_05125, partial [Clostridia bacterium]|nr:hypothetical protein [Clostridia bacterium]
MKTSGNILRSFFVSKEKKKPDKIVGGTQMPVRAVFGRFGVWHDFRQNIFLRLYSRQKKTSGCFLRSSFCSV